MDKVKELNFCVDCKKDISYLREDAQRCKSCNGEHRKKFFTKYRKSEMRKQTIKRDNDSDAGRYRKRKYNITEKAKLSHLKYRRSAKGRLSIQAVDMRRRMRLAEIRRTESGGFDVTAKELKELKERYPICVYCGGKEKLSVDHFVPVAKAKDLNYRGLNDVSNLFMTCSKCNHQKSDLLPPVFFQKYPEKKKFFDKVTGGRASV